MLNDKEIIKSAMKVRGVSQKMLAEAMGLKNQSNVSMMLCGSDSVAMKLRNFVTALNSMGFDIIVKDRNGANTENKWVLTDTEQDGVEKAL